VEPLGGRGVKANKGTPGIGETREPQKRGGEESSTISGAAGRRRLLKRVHRGTKNRKEKKRMGKKKKQLFKTKGTRKRGEELLYRKHVKSDE